MAKKIILVMLASLLFVSLVIPGSNLRGAGGLVLKLDGVWLFSVCVAPVPYGDCFVKIKI